MKKKLLISTGGSGGHVIPAFILTQHLQNENDITISTDKRGTKFIRQDINNLKIIDTPKLDNFFLVPFNLIVIFFLILKSIFLLKSEKITTVISTGGYMSLPLIIASKFLGLKIFLLEPNLVLGRANRYFLNSCVKIICYTDQIKDFPDKFRDKIVTINPLVREEFYKSQTFKEKKNEFVLSIIGGSQSASVFDEIFKKPIVNISRKYALKVIHQTTKKNIFNLKNFYSKNNIKCEIFSFNNNFLNLVEKSDLCITRAGASSLAELSLLNIPFLAVPLPNSKDNHQYENANFYKNEDCCWILNQDILSEKFEEFLNSILEDKASLSKKKENLKKLNYQNTWINVNQKISRIINEN